MKKNEDSIAKRRKITSVLKKGLSSDIRGYMQGQDTSGQITPFNFQTSGANNTPLSFSQPNPSDFNTRRSLFTAVKEPERGCLNVLQLSQLTPRLATNANTTNMVSKHPLMSQLQSNLMQIKMVQQIAATNTPTEEPEQESISNETIEDMSSQQIIMMLQDINLNIGQLRKDMQLGQHKKQLMQEETQLLTRHAETSTAILDQMRAELSEQDWKINMLVDTVMRQEQKIEELRWKDEKREQKEMGDTFYIDNLLHKKDEDLITVVSDFISTNLKISDGYEIKAAYRCGNSKPKSVCVKVNNIKERTVIFQNIGNLKDVKNSEGKKYYLNKLLPARIKEEKRREKDIIRENYLIPQASRPTVDRIDEGLQVGESIYHKKILPPTVKQLIHQPAEKKQKRRQIIITAGNQIEVETSQFYGYSAFVKNFDEIELAYLNVKEKHAAARHVCCAYRLPGTEVAYLQDYVDDDEPGVGRVLLELLKDIDAFNRVIFVARHYPGDHVGDARFLAFKQAALSAIIKAPTNRITGNTEITWTDVIMDTLNQPLQPNFKRRGTTYAQVTKKNIRGQRSSTRYRHTGNRAQQGARKVTTHPVKTARSARMGLEATFEDTATSQEEQSRYTFAGDTPKRISSSLSSTPMEGI